MRKLLAKYQRIINGLAIVSIAAVILVTILRFLPAAFPHANVIGDLIFDLAIAYLGAWFFNLLVIEIPRRRQRTNALKAIDFRLKSLATSAAQLRFDLSKTTETGIRLGASLQDVHTDLMLGCIPASARNDGSPTPMQTIQDFHERKLREFAQVDSLILLYFDVELHSAAETVLTSAFFRMYKAADWTDERHMKALAKTLDTLQVDGDELVKRLEEARSSI